MKEIQFVYSFMDSKFWNWLLQIQRLIMFVSTFFMLLMLGAVVIARYVLHVDIYGYDEILLIDSFWMYFIGASYAMCKEEHIKADILASMLSKKTVAVTKITAGVLQIIINVIIAILAYNMVARAIKTWAVTTLWNIPYFIPQISILLSFVIITIYLVIYTIRDYNNFVLLKKEG